MKQRKDETLEAYRERQKKYNDDYRHKQSLTKVIYLPSESDFTWDEPDIIFKWK